MIFDIDLSFSHVIAVCIYLVLEVGQLSSYKSDASDLAFAPYQILPGLGVELLSASV